MAEADKVLVTVECVVDVSVEKAWVLWTNVDHIVHWSLWPGWHVPGAVNDLTKAGRFFYRMEDKSTKEGFDYSGVHDEIEECKLIRSHLDDGRTIEVAFSAETDCTTRVTQTLQPKSTYSAELQKQGWQEVMDTFRAYAETA